MKKHVEISKDLLKTLNEKESQTFTKLIEKVAKNL